MASAMVERATSDMLIGADWAMNMEICSLCSRDPAQAKDAVKALKKRISSKNAKIQILALTLLETMVRNCGDIVHMYVAEKDVLSEMVKIVKKKEPDSRVKDKILTLIDSWQIAAGGPRARYPQYFAAYHELVHSGVEFPKVLDRTAPKFSPPQSQHMRHPQSSEGSPDYQQAELQSAIGAKFSALELADVQNARRVMNVLGEMLSAADPGNREQLRQEAIVELVNQCRQYKQRIVQLISNTSDEEMLSQSLALNDDMEQLLAKHDAIAAGIAVQVERKPKTLGALVDIEDSTSTTQDLNKGPADQSTSNMPPVDDSSAASSKLELSVDLLSGWESKPAASGSSLPLVPVSESIPEPSNTSTALVPVDTFREDDHGNSAVDSHLSLSNPQPHSAVNQLQQQPESNLAGSGAGGQGIRGPPPLSAAYYDGYGGTLQAQQIPNGQYGMTEPAQGFQMGAPEAQLSYNAQPASLQPPQPMPMFPPAGEPLHPAYYNQFGAFPTQQMAGIYPQQLAPMQMAGMQYPMYGGQILSYGYPPPQAPFYNQGLVYGYTGDISTGMNGLSFQENHPYNGTTPMSQLQSSSPMQQPMRPSKPKDNLFGDLVDMSKLKPSKA